MDRRPRHTEPGDRVRLLLCNDKSPGDALMLTAAVRDLHHAFPGRYLTAVQSPCMELFRHNPLVISREELGVPDRVIECDCPAVDRANQRPLHFLQGVVEDLGQRLGVHIPPGPFRGEVHLSQRELQLPSPVVRAGHAGRYWIVMAGGKHDFTTKWWNPEWYQEVVDFFRGRIQFVQCGERGHWHPPLRNVINLVGATDIRRFIRVMYHADGVLCPITFAMHLAAAVPPRPDGPARRACVVIAGGLEPPQWEMYPNHQFLHTVGALDCCAAGGCWRRRCQSVGDDEPPAGDECLQPVTVRDRLRIGKCMTMITPAKVIEAIKTYYEGGVLKYSGRPEQPTGEGGRKNFVAGADLAERSGRSDGRQTGIAVTIGVGAYAELAQLAARALQRKTGLETVIFGDREFTESGLEHPHYLKFRLFDLVAADNILYFDADMVCLDRWDPAAYFSRPEIGAVYDPQASAPELSLWGIPAGQYFNTGLLILNRKHHRAWLERAESLRHLHPTSVYDQVPLNAARVQLDIPLKLLDRRYNWVGFGECSLSHQMPVFMAHKLEPECVDANVRFFKGLSELPPPRITLDEPEIRRLSGRTLTYAPAGACPATLHLREDGVVTTPTGPSGTHGIQYWFVHVAKGMPTLALASPTRILEQFTQKVDGLWSSTAPQSSARCVDESIYREVKLTPRNARGVADRFMQSVPPYPPGRFSRRGIVICSGQRHFPSAWVCIRMLRKLGCSLPIELWHLGTADLPLPMRKVIEPYSVHCLDASEVRRQHPVRRLGSWELKPYAILHSGFEEVLLLDADNVPVADPTYLFSAEQFRAQGAIFWPDYERLAPKRAIWRICRVPYRDEPEFETGQVLVGKERCWNALQLTMHMNEHSDFYYHHVLGDKETFHMAWRMLGQEYAMVPWPIKSLRGTMCQHDFQGRRLFQHRNRAKWELRGENLRVEGFEYEDLCLEFLGELARKLDGAVMAESAADHRQSPALSP